MVNKFPVWLKSLFCSHDWEEVWKIGVYREKRPGVPNEMPAYYVLCYRCKNCGYVQQTKLGDV